LSVSGLAAIFQASACSRPPEPNSRIFMDFCLAFFSAFHAFLAGSGALASRRRYVAKQSGLADSRIGGLCRTP
jgi:hypothetical protein